jgi:hypothetical protein
MKEEVKEEREEESNLNEDEEMEGDDERALN